MIIEQSSLSVISETKSQNYFWPLILGTLITLTATTLPILFVIIKSDRPTGSLLSPLPEGVITESRTPTPSLAQALSLAQNYLNKAYDLARNPNQTPADKSLIKISLDNSLRQLESLLQQAPENHEAIQLRTKVLAEIKNLIPNMSATNAAEPDLIVAAPGQDSSSSGEANQESNANQKRFVLPAGQTQMTIKDTQIKTNSYIYLLPVDNSGTIVSLKSKTAGSFTISADSTLATDVVVDYYIIND